MGMFDSFYDEDSECPKCHTKVKGDWQTKRLQSLMESWRRGDFLQYRRLEVVPEEERKEKDRGTLFGAFRRTSDYLSDAPLLFNGKVPVHTSCDKCDARLEAYAKILDGRFVGIVEVEADGEEKELVLIKPETTAQTLREEFNRRLTHLQESCKHEKAEWMDMEWAPGHSSGRGLICVRCEKVLRTRR